MDYQSHGFAAYKHGMVDEAATAWDASLAGTPRDWRALYGLANVYYDAGRLGRAQVFAGASLGIEQNVFNLNVMGRIKAAQGEWEKALGFFEFAHEKDPAEIDPINNAAMACINLARYEDARAWLESVPADAVFTKDLRTVDRNWAFVHLFAQNWPEAWKAYDLGLGSNDRIERKYSDSVWKWNKDTDAKLPTVIYGEQGIGDEILFASCFPDAIADMEAPYIETMPRLVGLFSRSFPSAKVYGTRYEDRPHWIMAEGIERKISAGQLPGLYRNNDEDFPRTPFLKACSQRRAAVKGLLDPMPRKKKIGIAWTGGTVQTGYLDRALDLDAMMKALSDIDAEFISLQHTLADGERPEEYGVFVFPWLTHRDLDYDNTAALVAELDLVVGPPTSVVHLAGALGTPALVLQPQYPQWRTGGPSIPWYGCVESLFDWSWDDVAAKVEGVLNGSE